MTPCATWTGTLTRPTRIGTSPGRTELPILYYNSASQPSVLYHQFYSIFESQYKSILYFLILIFTAYSLSCAASCLSSCLGSSLSSSFASSLRFLMRAVSLFLISSCSRIQLGSSSTLARATLGWILFSGC